MKRKLFSVLLSVAMVMVMMPSMAFAAEGETAGGVPPESTALANPSESTTTEDHQVSTAEGLANAVANGGNITLKNDITTTGFSIPKDKSVILDLNGHTLALSGSYIDQYGNLDVLNGTINGRIFINASDKDEAYNRLIVRENATIKGAENAVIIYQKQDGIYNFGTTVDIYGRLEGNLWVMGNIKTNLKTAKNPCTVNVHDGAVINVGSTNTGIGLQGAAILNVGNAEITGSTGIEVRAGKLTVDGATIKGEAIPTSVTPNGNGTTTDGAGIAIAQHTTKLPIDVTIESGKISGYTALYESNPQNNETKDSVNIKVNDGEFNAIKGGTNSVYSENKKEFIYGGTFSSDPTAYVAKDEEDLYIFKPNDNKFLVGAAGIGIYDDETSGGTKYLTLGKKYKANYGPEGASECVEWFSNDEKVVKIDKTTGEFETVGVGETAIFGKAIEGKVSKVTETGSETPELNCNLTIHVSAPYVPSTPSTPPEKTETSTETKPNGDQVTTTTTTNTATGAVTEKVETVKPDGTKSEVTTETKTDKKADGTVVKKEVKTTVETDKDGKKTETKVETETTTRPDGTATETTTTTNADKSKEIVEKKTSKNDFDNDVTEVTTTTVSATGEKTVEQTTTIDTKQVGTITVDVQRDAEGKVKDATAEYAKDSKVVKGGTKVYLNGNHAKQIAAVLGDEVESVEITVTIKAESGENSFTITAQTKDLKADKELYIVAVDKDGNQTLVNATTYKTSSVGSISAVLDDGSNYQIITKEEKDALVKAIKATIAPKAKVKAVTAGKTSKIALKNTLNRANVKSITYKTSKRSVATVSKNGTIIGKKAGKATISATVTLKDGSKKTVKMTVTVKAKKYNK